MSRSITYLTIAAALHLSACTAVPQSRPMSDEAIKGIQRAHVVVMNSGENGNFTTGTKRTDANQPVLVQVPDVGIGRVVGAGIIANVILNAIVGGDIATQREESNALLKRTGGIPNSALANQLVYGYLRVLSEQNTDIKLASINIGEDDRTTSNYLKNDPAAIAVILSVKQSLSLDLSKLRVHIKAEARGVEHVNHMEQNIFYLPISVPGTTKEATLENWSAEGYKLYQEHLELAIKAAVDVLNATLFSQKSNGSKAKMIDASILLKRTNCFGGDYDAGIPMSAYKKGTILVNRKEYVAVTLENNDVLIFPQCDI